MFDPLPDQTFAVVLRKEYYLRVRMVKRGSKAWAGHAKKREFRKRANESGALGSLLVSLISRTHSSYLFLP